MERLRQRADFLAAATGAKAFASAFVLQAVARPSAGAARVGFTASKKVGNAVERNRVRRRLKAIVRQVPATQLRPGHDYVLVARRAALDAPFGRLIEDLERAIGRVHAEPPRPQRGGKSPSGTSHAGSAA